MGSAGGSGGQGTEEGVEGMMGFGVGWGAGFISRRRCGRSFY